MRACIARRPGRERKLAEPYTKLDVLEQLQKLSDDIDHLEEAVQMESPRVRGEMEGLVTQAGRTAMTAAMWIAGREDAKQSIEEKEDEETKG